MIRKEDFVELQREVRILRKNVRDLTSKLIRLRTGIANQEQLQNAYERIKELGEKNEQTTR
jgi:hypothetical protein